MDVCTEQAYQRCIAELTHQLAERDARIVDLRAQVADMSVKVAVLTQQATNSNGDAFGLTPTANNREIVSFCPTAWW